MCYFEGSRWQLAASVTWQHEGDALIFYSDTVFKLDDCPAGLIRCLPLLERGSNWNELSGAWGSEGLLHEYLKLLCHLRFVVHAVGQEWLDTSVERQVYWLAAAGFEANTAQRQVSGSHVAVLGVGGIGSMVLQLLAGAGVQHYTLIDHDMVCLNNLNRQLLFSPMHVGKAKVSVAADWLNSFEPRCVVYTHQTLVNEVEDLIRLQDEQKWDCLVLAADHPVGLIQDIAYEFCERAGVAVLSGGCGFKVGAWGPLLRPNEVGQWREYRSSLQRSSHGLPPPAKEIMKASFGPMNAFIASMMTHDLILYLVGTKPMSSETIVSVDFQTLQITRQPIVDCKYE